MTNRSNVTCSSTEERLRAHINTQSPDWFELNKINKIWPTSEFIQQCLCFHKALEEKFTA